MLICLVGGSGFVGSALAARLVECGYRVRVLTRRRNRHRDLLVLPTVEVVEGDVHDPAFLEAEFARVGAVVNLVGILNERGRSGRKFADGNEARAARQGPRAGSFEYVHVELTRSVIAACRAAGVRRLLHMSALNASSSGLSHYLRTKGIAEELAHKAHGPALQVTSFRPSVIFGPADSFTNRFAGLLRLAPGIFPLACPEARFQPVYVGDVVEAFVRALGDHRTFGNRYALCGPRVYTLRELVQYIAGLIGRRVCIIGLGKFLSRLQAGALEFLPGKPFSLDNYRSLQFDSVCTQGFPAIFGVTPRALEEIAPRYLHPRDRNARYASLRAGPRRD